MSDPEDSRSPLSQAAAVAAQVTTIALEMAVPAVLGFWLDRWLGTRPVFAVLGGLLGLAAGMFSLIGLAKSMGRDNKRKGR